MTVTVNIHGATFTARAFSTFVTLEMDDDAGSSVHVFLATDAACDDLIKAALLAKDLRHGLQHAAASAPVPAGLPVLDGDGGEDTLDPAPEERSPHTAAPAAADADWGSATALWTPAATVTSTQKAPAPAPEEHHLAGLRDREHYADAAEVAEGAGPKDVSTISEIPVIADAMAAKVLAELDGERGEDSPAPDWVQRDGENRAAWIRRLLTANLITVAEAEQMTGSTTP